MSRPPAHPSQGLALLRAAVADARGEELSRSARAAMVAGEPGSGHRVAHRVATTPRTPSVATPVVPVPAPAPAGDALVEHAPAEGETAVTLALVQRAQAGDAEAFGELYDRYVDLVYRYIYYRVGTTQLAEDLTSETFLRALRRITSFTWQGRDVGAWFVTIARNLIADHYKSGRYRLEMTTDDVSESGSTKLVEDGPENSVLEAMQNKVLLEAVKQLNAEQQECIVLRFLQGLSVAETAEAMGKNDGAIKALQYRAIRSLGRLLPEGVEL
ncbi:MAG: sigma-70 family RNA polymerase sigma factor [Actinobacteria bacterium]|nr:sigma-70 family RNA polymerase sigma factor [Actinomycetota bacterium]